MAPLAGAYLFLLGLASGITVLAITSYRLASPAWLRRLLIVTGFLVIGRYVTMALFTQADAPERFWALRRLWFATSYGLTLPSVVAVDQLIRHPAMTPKKLLTWFAPFLVAYLAVSLFGAFRPSPDPVAGWQPELLPAWAGVVSIVQTLFVLAFVGGCALFIRKIPVRPIQSALAILAAAHVALAIDGVVLAMGGWYFRPFLFSEMLMLLALWHAFTTAAKLQQA